MSKRSHNFGTKLKKNPFLFHARIALKSLILLFVRLIARGARIGKTHRHTDRTSTVTLAHARRGLIIMPGLNARRLQSKLLIVREAIKLCRNGAA